MSEQYYTCVRCEHKGPASEFDSQDLLFGPVCVWCAGQDQEGDTEEGVRNDHLQNFGRDW